MEWTVITVLIAIVGLFLTVGKPILNFCTEMKALRMEVNFDENRLQKITDDIEELSKITQSHEIRIHDQKTRVKENENGKDS